jgi:signal transduction histidine kinase
MIAANCRLTEDPLTFLVQLANLVAARLDSPAALAEIEIWLRQALRPYAVELNFHDKTLPGDSKAGASQAAKSRDCPDSQTVVVTGPPATLTVWLPSNATIAGTLRLSSSEADAFGPEDEKLARLIVAQLAFAHQQTHILETTRRREGDLAAFYQATSAISSAYVSLENISRTTLLQFIKIFHLDRARLLLWEVEPQRFIPHLALGRSGEIIHEIDKAYVDDDLLQNMILQRRPLPVQNGRTAEETAFLGHLKAASAVLAPLVIRSHTRGVLVLESSDHPREFSDNELAQIVTLSMHTAAAIENARLFEATRHSLSELAALQATALDISSRLGLPDLLQRLVERASHMVEASGGVIYLLNKEDNSLRAAVSSVPWADYSGRVVVVGQGVTGQVARTGKPFFVNDYWAWPQRSPNYQPERDLLRAAAGVPLKAEGEVVGVLAMMQAKEGRDFTPRDIYLLEMLAPQAAISIRNAQLFQQLEARMEELARTQQRLLQAEKLATVGRMVGAVAHELNNPLQAINNCLHLCLNQELASEKQTIYLEMATAEVKRLIETLRRMLEFYRPSQGSRQVVEAELLVNSVLDLMLPQLEEREISVQRLFEPAPAIWVVTDHIRQVLLNLVLNAADAMIQGGQLTVSVSRENSSEVAIRVKDNGSGIAPEALPLIFEPFFTTKDKGTGLGLATSLAIVEAHGGRLFVAPEPDGSCFCLILPTHS